MRSSVLATSLLLSTLLLSACAPKTSGTELTADCEKVGDNFTGIIGGRGLGAGNDLSSSTVLVKHTKSDGSILTCTGTILSDSTVLTAAHCTSMFGKSTSVAFTNNTYCAFAAADHLSRPVTETKTHYNYKVGTSSISNAGYDLALMKFSGGLPKGFKARDLPKQSFQPVAGEKLVIAGYGWTDEYGLSSGDLQYKHMNTEKIVSSFHMALVNRTLQVNKAVMVEQYEGGVCSGDSGGPLYVQTEKGLVLIGITSMGVDNRTKNVDSKRPCMGISLFTDVRQHLDWIYETSKAL